MYTQEQVFCAENDESLGGFLGFPNHWRHWHQLTPSPPQPRTSLVGWRAGQEAEDATEMEGADGAEAVVGEVDSPEVRRELRLAEAADVPQLVVPQDEDPMQSQSCHAHTL